MLPRLTARATRAKRGSDGTFRAMSPRRPNVSHLAERVPFHRVKYGRELLVDVARIRDIPTFILDRPHTLEFYEIVLVTRGRGFVWLDADRYPVRTGGVLFTSPGQIRRWQSERLDGICLLFPAMFLEEFFRDESFVDRLPFFRGGAGTGLLALSPVRTLRLQRRLEAMRRELHRLRADSVHLLRARLYEILVMLARIFAKSHRISAVAPIAHDLTTRFRALVREQATARHGVESYARDLAVSPGYLNRVSKRYLGQTAKAVIRDALVLEARRRLLYSNESAARVGYALGFVDPSYFTRFFRRSTGQTPNQFRRIGK